MFNLFKKFSSIKIKILFFLNSIFIYLLYLKISNKENLCENIYLSSTIPDVTVQYFLIISILLLLGLLIYKIHAAFLLVFNMYLARYFYKSLFMDISKFECLGFRSKKKIDIGQILVEKNNGSGPELKSPTKGWFDFLNHIDYVYWSKVALVVATVAVLVFTIYKVLSGNGGFSGSDGCNPNKPPYVHYHCHKNHSNPSVTEYTRAGSNVKNVYRTDSNNDNVLIQQIEKIESYDKPTLLKNSEVLVNKEPVNVSNLLEQSGVKPPVNRLPKLSLRDTLEKKLSETSIGIDTHSIKPEIGKLDSLLQNNNYFFKRVPNSEIENLTYGEVSITVKSMLNNYQLMLNILKNDSNIKQNIILNQQRKEFLDFMFLNYKPKLQNLFFMCTQTSPTVASVNAVYSEMQLYTSKFITIFKPSLNDINKKEIDKLLKYAYMGKE